MLFPQTWKQEELIIIQQQRGRTQQKKKLHPSQVVQTKVCRGLKEVPPDKHHVILLITRELIYPDYRIMWVKCLQKNMKSHHRFRKVLYCCVFIFRLDIAQDFSQVLKQILIFKPRFRMCICMRTHTQPSQGLRLYIP